MAKKSWRDKPLVITPEMLSNAFSELPPMPKAGARLPIVQEIKPDADLLRYQRRYSVTPQEIRPSEIKLDDLAWQKMNQANIAVNKAMIYTKDRIEQYDKGKKHGDCEDFALNKYEQLKKMGIPASAMMIATVDDGKDKSAIHAVLIVRTDRGDFVLDNDQGQNVIKHWHETPYAFSRLDNPDSSVSFSPAIRLDATTLSKEQKAEIKAFVKDPSRPISEELKAYAQSIFKPIEIASQETPSGIVRTSGVSLISDPKNHMIRTDIQTTEIPQKGETALAINGLSCRVGQDIEGNSIVTTSGAIIKAIAVGENVRFATALDLDNKKFIVQITDKDGKAQGHSFSLTKAQLAAIKDDPENALLSPDKLKLSKADRKQLEVLTKKAAAVLDDSGLSCTSLIKPEVPVTPHDKLRAIAGHSPAH